MGATVAGVAGAAASAYGAYSSSSKQSSAAMDAADLQYSASVYATDKQTQMFDRQLERYDAAINRQMPWYWAGNTALSRMNIGMDDGSLLNFKFNEKKMMKDPGYKFRVSEGMNALKSAAAVGGSMGSGNMLAAAENLGQNLASEEYNAAYARQYGEWTDKWNKLSQVAGYGQNAAQSMAGTTASLGALSASTANSISSLITQGASAQAQGILGSANAWSNGINNMTSAFNSGLGTYMNYSQNQSLLNNLFGGGSGATSNSLYGYNMGSGGWDSGYSLGSSGINDASYYLGYDSM